MDLVSWVDSQPEPITRKLDRLRVLRISAPRGGGRVDAIYCVDRNIFQAGAARVSRALNQRR
jgi:hypothetical protein